MSRHRKVRALDYDEEYDEYYNDDNLDYYDDYVEPVKTTSNKALQTQPQKHQNEQTQKQATTSSQKSQPNGPSKSKTTSKQASRYTSPKPQISTAVQLKNPSTSVSKKTSFASTVKEYEDFVKSVKPRVNLVVVGHVDAGKSTLVGHFLCEIGSLTQKQMHRNEVDSQRSGKASFKYAWALDETEDERQRGVTIDIAFTKFETKQRVIVVVDSPGHVDFVPAVISGAAQADAALLVIDATRGEFETGFGPGGQTKEHAFLVRSLGVKSLIVVVNKMDNAGWSLERYEEIKSELMPFLKQAGFNLQDDIQFVACSGLTGENLVKRRQNNAFSQSSHPQLEGNSPLQWRNMICLMEALDKLPTPARLVDGPTRVVVNDIYKGLTGGVSLAGKVCGGKIVEKKSLLLLPPNEMCDIKSVEVKDVTGAPPGRAFAGDIVTIITTGIDLNKFYKGCVLCEPSMPCHVTNRFLARIVMFQGTDSILIRGTTVEVHINGTYESGLVRRLLCLINKTTGEILRTKPKCVPRNSSAIIQLRLDRPVCMELYSDNRDLGRFMMRSCGKTIAAGLVTKIKAAKVPNLRKMKSK